MIPSSLHHHRPHDDGAHDTGQEMQDRGGRIVLGTASHRLDKTDSWGSYLPEITMEDREDDKGPQIRHVEFAEGGPKN